MARNLIDKDLTLKRIGMFYSPTHKRWFSINPEDHKSLRIKRLTWLEINEYLEYQHENQSKQIDLSNKDHANHVALMDEHFTLRKDYELYFDVLSTLLNTTPMGLDMAIIHRLNSDLQEAQGKLENCKCGCVL